MKLLFLLLGCVVAGALAQFTAAGKQAIVDAHNNLRSSIAKGTYVAKGTLQKPGANLRKMKWNDTIASSVQKYVNTCPTAQSKTPGYGENLYLAFTTLTPLPLDSYGTEASSAWGNEFQSGWTSNIFDTDPEIAHATQMAWADTFAIGCGVKNCGVWKGNFVKIAVVCQYYPQGNYMYKPIYKLGATCSACPSGTKCESATGLCV